MLDTAFTSYRVRHTLYIILGTNQLYTYKLAKARLHVPRIVILHTILGKTNYSIRIITIATERTKSCAGIEKILLIVLIQHVHAVLYVLLECLS